MTITGNKLSSVINNISKLPPKLRTHGLTFAVGNAVKFAGTAKVEILEMTPTRLHGRIRNRKRVQNHIGTVHAAAMALLAESVTGLVVGMSVPDNRTPVIKSMKVEYMRRAKGDLEAVATLTQADVDRIILTEKGEITVPVKVTDADGNEPIQCEMIWAWTPKRPHKELV
jgi:uncharacterized protein (TIGR00369 family)